MLLSMSFLFVASAEADFTEGLYAVARIRVELAE